MDADRLELYELLKPKLEEEAARRLVLALPAHPDELVTKTYLDARTAEQIDKLTWRMVTVVGAWTVIATSLFTFMARLL